MSGVNLAPGETSIARIVAAIRALIRSVSVFTASSAVGAGGLASMTIPAQTRVIYAEGYYSAGDGGEGLLVRSSVQSAGAGKIASANGVYFQPVPGAKSLRALGVRCDGATVETSELAAAMAACSALGLTKVTVPGMCVTADTASIPSDLTLEGHGPITGFKRAASSVDGTFLSFVSKSNITFRNLTIDGNKTHQSVAANSLHFAGSHSITIDSVKVKDSKGAGIVLDACTDAASNTRSAIRNCHIESNDSTAIFAPNSSCIDIVRNKVRANGSGIVVANFTIPPVAESEIFIEIIGNECVSNAGSGIAASGFVAGEGLTPGSAVYGPTVPETAGIIVQNNICRSNSVYGIAFQATRGVCNGNITRGNAAGGILFNASYSSCHGNSSFDDTGYGIDAGGAFHCSIAGNQIENAGQSFGVVGAIGINLGAGINTVCSGNTIHFGTYTGAGIVASGVDGDGATPFPFIGTGLHIFGNRIFCNGVVGGLGIWVRRRLRLACIHDNYVSDGDSQYGAYVFEADVSQHDNRCSFGGTMLLSAPSGATTVIPDAGEVFYISGTTNIDYIRTYSSTIYNQKVRDVEITNGGSGYTSAPTVSFAGGGGAGAAATADVDNGGRVISVTMTNNGSGYTGTPTVSFAGGGGAAAAGTALVGCLNFEGRVINLMFQGTLTAFDSTGNLGLNGDLSATNTTVVALRGAFGAWREVSRCTS